MTEVMTLHDLQLQTRESRARNIFQMVEKQLSMQFGIDGAEPEDRILYLKPFGDKAQFLLEGPAADRFAICLGRHFRFLKSPAALLEQLAQNKDSTLADLVHLILEKVGA